MALKLTDRDVDGVTVVAPDGRLVLGEEKANNELQSSVVADLLASFRSLEDANRVRIYSLNVDRSRGSDSSILPIVQQIAAMRKW